MGIEQPQTEALWHNQVARFSHLIVKNIGAQEYSVRILYWRSTYTSYVFFFNLVIQTCSRSKSAESLNNKAISKTTMRAYRVACCYSFPSGLMALSTFKVRLGSSRIAVASHNHITYLDEGRLQR